MIAIGVWAELLSQKKNETIQVGKYLHEVRNIFNLLSKGKKSKLKKYLKGIGFVAADPKNLKNHKTVFNKPLTFGSIKILKSGNEYYLKIEYLDESLLLYDMSQDGVKREKIFTNLLLFLDIAILLFIYLMIIKMVSPLKEISDKMRAISNGDLDARVDVDRKDEVGEMAESFNEMASKLQAALKSKEELLRDVGHELRTPIAKGKFAVEMIENSEGKQIIKKAFSDLDALTNEILNIQIMDSGRSLKIEKFKSSTLIVEAMSKIDLKKEEDVVIDTEEEFGIEGDLYYLSVALKNIIENGLKYTSKLPIFIEVKKRRICVVSFGEKLNKELSYYTQPFVRGSREKEGFGLGLNIVFRVVNKHHFKLTYDYRDGKNIFCIDMNGTNQSIEENRKPQYYN